MKKTVNVLLCVTFPLALASFLYFGCSSTSNQTTSAPAPDPNRIISGIITDVKVCECDHYLNVLIYFSDGRIVKLYTNYHKFWVFEKNQVNVIEHDADGEITYVKVEK